jgi:hypothetical protein
MDDLTVVTVLGKYFLLSTDKGQVKLVGRGKIVTRTGTRMPDNYDKYQRLYLTLASLTMK